MFYWLFPKLEISNFKFNYCKKISRVIRIMYKLRPFLPLNVMKNVYYSRSGLYWAKVSDFVFHFLIASPKYKKHKSKEIFEKYWNNKSCTHFSGHDWKSLKIPSEMYQKTGYHIITSNTGHCLIGIQSEIVYNYTWNVVRPWAGSVGHRVPQKLPKWLKMAQNERKWAKITKNQHFTMLNHI